MNEADSGTKRTQAVDIKETAGELKVNFIHSSGGDLPLTL